MHRTALKLLCMWLCLCLFAPSRALSAARSDQPPRFEVPAPGAAAASLVFVVYGDTRFSRRDDVANAPARRALVGRSEEHTSELQSPDHLVCRLLLEKKKKRKLTKSIINTKKHELRKSVQECSSHTRRNHVETLLTTSGSTKGQRHNQKTA